MIQVRKFCEDDIPTVVNYWNRTTDYQLQIMGINPARLPNSGALSSSLESVAIESSKGRASRYLTVTSEDEEKLGVCILNGISGSIAYFHLHIFDQKQRNIGIGRKAIELSMPIFCTSFSLQTVLSEVPVQNVPANTLASDFGTYIGRRLVKETEESILKIGQEINIYEYKVGKR